MPYAVLEMPTEPPEEALTPDELLAFGGLARALVRADGQFTEEEAIALEEASADLFRSTTLTGGTYRTPPTTDHDGDSAAVFELLERASVALPDDDAIRRAAKQVTRQFARELIFGILYEVAASDVISKSEWPLLDWLSKEWGVDPSR